jgi:type IV pilus assembly protein PilB
MRLYSFEEIYNVIRELDIVPVDQLKDIQQVSRKDPEKFAQLLVKRDLMSDANLGKVIADLINIPYVNLYESAIDDDTLKTLPEIFAKKQKVIAFKRDKKGLHVAMADPTDKRTKEFIARKIGMPVNFYYCTERGIENALALYAKDVKKVFSEIINESIAKAKGSKKPEPSIVKIVDTILEYAYQNKSSDIHIEPGEEKSVVRFRIDGMLHDIVDLPLDLHAQVVTRVKVMARLRTDEHQAAQDGKISTEISGESLDIRVSIVPVTNGEKIVMRLLSEKSRQFSLQDLGFGESDLKKVMTAYQKPHGMILSTGPTGSGKTTTLYAILKLLNKRNVNIMTIEDPVEYDIEGVNQIQVNAITELNFAKGLRSIVRQDPDIILVGEIRDEETADISINAAMTGHLVLSTLHTNDSATAIPRLIDLKVEPFLIGSTINVIIAQRLVRKICVNCRLSEDINRTPQVDQGNDKSPIKDLSREFVEKLFGENNTMRIYRGKGCELCHDTGYVGRVGIFEVMIVDESIRDAINTKQDASDIKALAVKGGMTTMLEDGIEKIKQGVTTIEEVLRVTKE